MTNDITLPRDLFHEDNLYELSCELYEARNIRRLTLGEGSAHSGLSVEEIDDLESGIGDINFSHAARLLDLYNMRLNLTPECYPGLPPEYYAE